MNSPTISIFKNQILSNILSELSYFSKFKIKFYDEIDLCIKESTNHNELIIFFLDEINDEEYKKLANNKFPKIVAAKSENLKKVALNSLVEKINIPFKVFDLEKKINSLLAKYKFSKSSVINLHGYIIDKNERKIKKNKLELQLTEKEIDFLILFSKNNEPINRNDVLKNVWKYSSESDTHTVETHIHRLRKKILEKFGDSNFIKNNNKGYYI
tara:strand:- start:92 stop:730 length:639 start_codon:yes stop_codon:yes gene_type:complete